METNKEVVLKVLKGAFIERDATVVDRYIGWGPKPLVAVDIFKMKDGKVLEHWDVMQEEVPASATASGNPMFTPASETRGA